jgi:hypothetical protein
MAPPLTSAALQPYAPEESAMTQFRLGDEHNSDASDSDQSDASGRALSPSRKGLTKSGKRKERKQFGAFADELGDLLGAAFQQPANDSAAASSGTIAPRCLLLHDTNSSMQQTPPKQTVIWTCRLKQTQVDPRCVRLQLLHTACNDSPNPLPSQA